MEFSMDEFIDEIIIARHDFWEKDRTAGAYIGCKEEETRQQEAAAAACHLLDLRKRLRMYIGTLAPGLPREVLTRHYVQYQTWDTIAEAVGCHVDEVEEIMEKGFREIEAAHRAGRIVEP